MWDILPNDDETMIVDSVRAFLVAELPIGRLRPNVRPVDAAAVWRGMADLGWFGVGLPENGGGSGLGPVEEALIQRECARHLATPSLLATVLAGHVAHAAGDLALAARFASGEVSAALALPQGYAFDWAPGGLLLAWNAQGMGLFEVEAFVDCQPDQCLDNSVTMHGGRLDLERALHWVDSATAPLAMRAQVLIAAALAGLAEQACATTVEYATTRQQFGKSIGAFQAVKHRCADMGVGARLAWYQTCMAALRIGAGVSDAGLHAASAKLVAARAAHENGRAAIQMHGGIGFQSECDVHWFMKRAHLYDQFGASAGELAREIAFAAPVAA